MIEKKLLQQNKKGFSLTEMIVTIGIIVILTSIIFVNWRSAREDFLLQSSAYKLAQDIRRALEMAMSLVQLKGGVTPAGYGVYFKAAGYTYYTLYADGGSGNEKYDEGHDTIIEEISFEKGVKIKSLSRNNLSINFKPPNPTVKISPAGPPSERSEVKITITLDSDLSKTKTIKVNEAGLIYVE